ncbi:MAG TPA: hypothetical protein VJA26_18230 [Gammaproteobacteria bacterium]|nr:hypothetical protein [Gammaproteobacteria bacterium]
MIGFSLRRLSLTLAVAGCAWLVGQGSASLASAQSAQRSASSIPDLAEIWARRGCTAGQPCPFIPSQLPLKARAIGFMQAFDEALGPKYDCVPATMPSLVIDPYNFKIEQHEDRLVFTYEKDDIVRTVWLNGNGPQPTVYDVYWQGHSVGHYEDDRLVIETAKFPFDPTGLDDMYNIPSSTQKKVIERYWREGNVLKADIVTEDPLFLIEAVQFEFEWERTDSPLELPYACDPQLAKQPLKFIPSKYQDPAWAAMPPLPSTPPSP